MLIFIVQLVKSFISLSATLMRHNILRNNHLKAKYGKLHLKRNNDK